jgi:E3 ubiquitin-protein ligase MYCBP2
MNCAFALYRVASDRGLLQRAKCGTPGCRALPEHPILADQYEHWRQILAQLGPLLLQVIRDERIDREPQVNSRESDYFRNPALFARDHCRFAMCEFCHSPYYAGRAACGEDDAKPIYRCAACEYATAHLLCEAHGDAGMVFKCFCCCRPAAFYCWGTTHFCLECHEEWQAKRACTVGECNGSCAFTGHPPNGTRQKFGYWRFCRAQKFIFLYISY